LSYPIYLAEENNLVTLWCQEYPFVFVW